MEEIIDFLGEYAETLEAMEQKQIEKLGLLMTRELDKVEQTIMMQEAMGNPTGIYGRPAFSKGSKLEKKA